MTFGLAALAAKLASDDARKATSAISEKVFIGEMALRNVSGRASTSCGVARTRLTGSKAAYFSAKPILDTALPPRLSPRLSMNLQRTTHSSRSVHVSVAVVSVVVVVAVVTDAPRGF